MVSPYFFLKKSRPHFSHRPLKSDDLISINQSINQSIYILPYSTEVRATVRLGQIKEKCLKTNLKCVNGWSSSTVQWKRVPESRSSNRETTSSSYHLVTTPALSCAPFNVVCPMFFVNKYSRKN